jgi:hypothetical protein
VFQTRAEKCILFSLVPRLRQVLVKTQGKPAGRQAGRQKKNVYSTTEAASEGQSHYKKQLRCCSPSMTARRYQNRLHARVYKSIMTTLNAQVCTGKSLVVVERSSEETRITDSPLVHYSWSVFN